MAMGRRVKPAGGPPPSLEANQPEVELIKPEELSPTPPIKRGIKGKETQEVSVQLRLRRTKEQADTDRLKEPGYDPRRYDGKIGSQHKKAVKDFQTANGLTPTGKVRQDVGQL